MKKRLKILLITLGILLSGMTSYSMRGKSYHRIALDKLNSKLEYLEGTLKKR